MHVAVSSIHNNVNMTYMNMNIHKNMNMSEPSWYIQSACIFTYRDDSMKY